MVRTSTVQHTVATGRRPGPAQSARDQRPPRLIVSGPAGTGKTIAITQLGLAHELLDRSRHPDDLGRIPVVYVTVPPAATPRMIAAEFARFLGLPVTARFNITDIIEAVVGVCTDARTGPVLVDELHNKSLTSRNGAEVADTLKYFSERIPATFVYAGINVERLLAGVRGEQIAAGRFTLIRTHPFPYGPEWKGLVRALEGTLVLLKHEPFSLIRLDRFLHERCGGMIGSLSHQIRGAAIDAILTGTEELTKHGLEDIPLDLVASPKPRRRTAR